MKVTPLPRRQTAVELCADSVRRQILTGELAPGSQLPPERELAEQLGVNRTTLRAALATLESANLLSVRQGSGYLVRNFRRTGGPALVRDLIKLQDPLDIAEDLYRVRRHLARAVMERMVERSEAPDLSGVEELFERYTNMLERGASREEYAEADTEIAAALLEACGGMVLQLMFNPLLPVMQTLPDAHPTFYTQPSEALMVWRGLLEWLKQPRGETIEPLIALLKSRDEKMVRELRRL